MDRTDSSTDIKGEEIVKLNVGGKSFSTYKSTLMTYPDTMLARMFSTSADIAKKGKDGEYFLDRNPQIFEVILEFYRTKQIVCPKSLPIESLKNELEYFGIDFEEDDILIAGEPKHAMIECYLSLVRAYEEIESNGHKLGTVVQGLPTSFDEGYEDEEEDDGDADEYTEAYENIQKALSVVSRESYFCCGGETDLTNKTFPPTVEAHLHVLPLPGDGNNNNNNDNADDGGKQPDCQFGENCYRKNPQHFLDFSHPNKPAKKIKTKPKKKNFADQQVLDCGPISNLNVDFLKNLCVPAPFGDLKTMQTKVDPNVRSALECDSSRFALPLNLQNEKYYIQENLNNRKPVKLVPYKVNVYEAGGFFKEHVDTPINPGEMIGSLVVCLPSAHEGGELTVTHNGISHTFDFAKKSGDHTITQWAAFFSDCIHEVKPVTSGTRITVTFLIETAEDNYYNRATKPSPSTTLHTVPIDAPHSASKIDALVKALTDELPEDLGNIGIFLSHKYTTTAITLETLKGSDKLLFETLNTKKGWVLHLTPVMYTENMTKQVDDYYDGKRFNASGNVYSFSMEDLKYLNNQGPKPDHALHSVPFVVSDQKGSMLHNRRDEGAEHTGNESRPAEEDSIYFHAALICERQKK